LTNNLFVFEVPDVSATVKDSLSCNFKVYKRFSQEKQTSSINIFQLNINFSSPCSAIHPIPLSHQRDESYTGSKCTMCNAKIRFLFHDIYVQSGTSDHSRPYHLVLLGRRCGMQNSPAVESTELLVYS